MTDEQGYYDTDKEKAPSITQVAEPEQEYSFQTTRFQSAITIISCVSLIDPTIIQNIYGNKSY